MEELDRLLDELLAEGPTVDELLAFMPSVDVDRLLVEVGLSDEEWAELMLWAEGAEAELDRLLVEGPTIEELLAELDHDPIRWGPD